jgi:hypothetical protein
VAVETFPMPMTDPMRQLEAAWGELALHLRARFRALSDEMRTYPTPIARCDEQLTRLIEQRDAARAELERLGEMEAGGGVSASPIDALEAFGAEGAADDDALAAVRSRLAAALASIRSERAAAVPRFLPSFPISEWK